MNWITKIIKAGEKIKTAIHKRATKTNFKAGKLFLWVAWKIGRAHV